MVMCSQCGSEAENEGGGRYCCPECGHEWISWHGGELSAGSVWDDLDEEGF
jgi:uncharacterized Zn ribbon protein